MSAAVETVTIATTPRQRLLLRGLLVTAYRDRLRARDSVDALVDARDLFDLALKFGVPAAELTP